MSQINAFIFMILVLVTVRIVLYSNGSPWYFHMFGASIVCHMPELKS